MARWRGECRGQPVVEPPVVPLSLVPELEPLPLESLPELELSLSPELEPLLPEPLLSAPARGSQKPSTVLQRRSPQHAASSKHHSVRSPCSMQAWMQAPAPCGGSAPGS